MTFHTVIDAAGEWRAMHERPDISEAFTGFAADRADLRGTLQGCLGAQRVLAQ